MRTVSNWTGCRSPIILRFRTKPFPAIILGVLLIILCLTFPGGVRAQSEATVQAIIATFTDYFNDVPAYATMTNEQKAEYILTQGRNRIVGRSIDLARSNLATYTEEVLRHKLMMKYLNDSGAQQVFMTMVLEGEAAGKAMQAKVMLDGYQKVNQQIAAINLGATLGAGAITGYLDNGISGAFWGTTQAAGEAYMESVIPFYGWAKLVVQAEAALINYFKGYVKEQQVQCALDQLYGKGFMNQLASKTKAEVDRGFENAWKDNDGFADVTCARYGYQAQGEIDPSTGKPFPIFKDDVKRVVMNMKDALDQKVKEAEAATKALMEADRGRVEGQLKAAEEKLKGAYDAAIAPAKPALAKIEELRRAMPAAEKTKAKETKAKVEQAQSQIKPVTRDMVYASLDRATITNALATALAEVRDSTGAGYNAENYERLFSIYLTRRNETIDGAKKKLEEDYIACLRQLNKDQEALFASCKEERGRLVCPGDPWAAGERMANERCRNNVPNQQKLANDIAILEQEEKLLRLEAQERGLKLAQALQERLAKIGGLITNANGAFTKGVASVKEETGKFGNLQAYWGSGKAYSPAVTFGLGWIGVYEGMKAGTFQPAQPGHIIESYRAAEAAREEAMRLTPLVPELERKERQVYSDYETALTSQLNQIEVIVRKNLLFAPTSGTQWSVHCGSFCDYLKVQLALPPLVLSLDDTKKALEEVKKPRLDLKVSTDFLQGAIDFMRADATQDELAVMINRAAVVLVAALGDYRHDTAHERFITAPRFREKNGIGSAEVLPEQSDGAAYLAAMKAAWEKNKGMLDKFQNWKKVYGKGLKYQGGDPIPFLASLDSYMKIPERIALAEGTMRTVAAERQQQSAQAEKALGDLKALMAKEVYPDAKINTAKNRVIYQLNQMIMFADMGSVSYGMIRGKVVAYKKELEDAIPGWEKELADYWEAQKRNQEAQRKNQIMTPLAAPAGAPAPVATPAATPAAPPADRPRDRADVLDAPKSADTPVKPADTPVVAKVDPPTPIVAPVAQPPAPLKVEPPAPVKAEPAPATPPVPVKPADTPVVAKTPEPAPVVPVVPPAVQPPAPVVAKSPDPAPVAVPPKPEPAPAVEPPKADPKPVTPVVSVVTPPQPATPVPASPAPVVAKADPVPPPKAEPVVAKVTPPPEKKPVTPPATTIIIQAGPSVEKVRPQILELYRELRIAYESKFPRNLAQVLSPSWQGPDGYTLASLQDKVGKICKTYEDVRVMVSNMRIEKIGDDAFRTSYDFAITVKPPKSTAKQEEKYAVVDELKVERSGKPKIQKTLSGKIWYAKE